MTDRKQPLPVEVRRAADKGDLITAIRVLRTTRGMDLRAAKEAVESYLRHGTRTTVIADKANVPADAVAFLHEGDLIGAIRRTREATGRGLKDSREAVGQFLAANPLIHEQFQAAARRNRGGPLRSLFWFVLVVAAVLVLLQLLRGG